MTDPRQKHIPEDLTGLPGYGIQPAADEAFVAEGKAAEHPWGVQYQGSFEGEADGTARAVRLHARALRAAGIPVFLQSFTGRFRGTDGSMQTAMATSERVKQEVRHIVHPSIGALRLRIKHAIIPHSDFLRSWIIPRSVMMEHNAAQSHAQMQALSRHALDLENHYTKPQDIEWAIDRDDRIFILQSRSLRLLNLEEQDRAVPRRIEDRTILIDKGVKPPFFDYLFADPYVVLTFGLIFLVISYFIVTLISWLYYKNKK